MASVKPAVRTASWTGKEGPVVGERGLEILSSSLRAVAPQRYRPDLGGRTGRQLGCASLEVAH